MRTAIHPTWKRQLAFTLIELLVVVAIMAILAAILLPAATKIRQKAALKRVAAELESVQTAIERYKTDLGFYPPDNLLQPSTNSLFYELGGVTLTNVGGTEQYAPLDGSAAVPVALLTNRCRIGGVMNVSVGGGEGVVARNYLANFSRAQFGNMAGIRVIATDVDGPRGGVNAFSYISSNPTNNPQTFDMWVDVELGGKTNRISNWSEKPEIVYYN